MLYSPTFWNLKRYISSRDPPEIKITSYSQKYDGIQDFVRIRLHIRLHFFELFLQFCVAFVFYFLSVCGLAVIMEAVAWKTLRLCRCSPVSAGLPGFLDLRDFDLDFLDLFEWVEPERLDCPSSPGNWSGIGIANLSSPASESGWLSLADPHPRPACCGVAILSTKLLALF